MANLNGNWQVQDFVHPQYDSLVFSSPQALGLRARLGAGGARGAGRGGGFDPRRSRVALGPWGPRGWGGSSTRGALPTALWMSLMEARFLFHGIPGSTSTTTLWRFVSLVSRNGWNPCKLIQAIMAGVLFRLSTHVKEKNGGLAFGFPLQPMWYQGKPLQSDGPDQRNPRWAPVGMDTTGCTTVLLAQLEHAGHLQNKRAASNCFLDRRGP